MRVFHILYPEPYLAVPLFGSFGLVALKKTGQLVWIDPDFAITVLLGFIKDQLDTEVQMDLINVVGILFFAVAGMSHIADDIAGSHNAALFQTFLKRGILA